MTVDRAHLKIARRRLGAHLATYRTAAGVSQPELGQALGRTRTTVSKTEHGTRGMPAAQWAIADDTCGAGGALIAEHEALAQAEQDYRDRCRAHHREARRAGAQARAAALGAVPVRAVYPRDRGSGHEAWLARTLVSGELAEELMRMITRLIRAIGRRDAMQTLGWVMAAIGLSELDPEESTRLAQAVATPSRVDAQVVHNLAAMLAQLRRQEDTLGAGEVLETAVAQHGLARRLLTGGCPDHWRQPLNRVDSAMASFIGNCLVNMGRPDEAAGYLGHARQAAHQAGNAACAAYAAAGASFAAFERGDTPTALDTAAAARSLAARTDDTQLKALAETNAAAAYALDGQYGPCMAAGNRAHDFLTNAPGPAPDSPASWFHHGRIDSRRSRDLCLLGRPKEALDAAITARAQHDQTSVRSVLCEVRLGHALALSQDITEAAQVLRNVADQVHLYPRLTGEFHAARALLQP
ncbi:MAG: helix-turn-helix domain-containing protein [Pseudonocardiaceae bacterium]